MASKHQLTGMMGVYLVAAELSRHGFVASPTSRSARGADILVTDQQCTRAFSVQVKTNASTFSYWLVNAHAKEMASPSHLYVLVNVRKGGKEIEYFVVPSKVAAEKVVVETKERSSWHYICYDDVKDYENRWDLFAVPQENAERSAPAARELPSASR